ncbi:hypothetical protein AAMO2058_001020900 [Amorphochlora amoebiformis]|mmetsp:Transcript_4139/g.6306  ORF Transcript_4139/g.6306 Transcript_4139/m.6306 type:complete len:175 (-) Transcript_4139:72-596(-)
MPFALLRYDNKFRFFSMEAPVDLVRNLAKDLADIQFVRKNLDDETRVTGEMARTGVTLRNVLDAIERDGWTLCQASTGGYGAGCMGNELYVFRKAFELGSGPTSNCTRLLMPPPSTRTRLSSVSGSGSGSGVRNASHRPSSRTHAAATDKKQTKTDKRKGIEHGVESRKRSKKS